MRIIVLILHSSQNHWEERMKYVECRLIFLSSLLLGRSGVKCRWRSARSTVGEGRTLKTLLIRKPGDRCWELALVQGPFKQLSKKEARSEAVHKAEKQIIDDTLWKQLQIRPLPCGVTRTPWLCSPSPHASDFTSSLLDSLLSVLSLQGLTFI